MAHFCFYILKICNKSFLLVSLDELATANICITKWGAIGCV